jgi:hypothetical protein
VNQSSRHALTLVQRKTPPLVATGLRSVGRIALSRREGNAFQITLQRKRQA